MKIHTIAAVAALACVPAFAMAQPYDSYDYVHDNGASTSDELTVQGQRHDQYSITINVAGKDPSTVRKEIWDAAYTACQRAPLTGNRADLTTDSMHACVDRAQWMGTMQYHRILNGQSLRRVDYRIDNY